MRFLGYNIHFPLGSEDLSRQKKRATEVARAAAVERNLALLSERMAELPQGRGIFSEQTSQVRARVDQIAWIQSRLDTVTRPAFREPLVAQLVATI